METQTRLSRHNKFISAKNIVGIFSISSDDYIRGAYNKFPDFFLYRHLKLL